VPGAAGAHRPVVTSGRRTERTSTIVTLDLSQARGGNRAATPPLDATPPFEAKRGAAAQFAGAQRHRTFTMVAVARDLHRLSGVLTGPVTPVRRTALVGHVGFLVEQAQGSGDDPPTRYGTALSRLRRESRLWIRDAQRRPELRAAVEIAAAAVDASRPALPAGPESDPRSADRAMVRLRDLPAGRPTALAYRYFWLLDELPPHLAQDVAAEFTGPARWALRNALSGGYNRRAYLMWIGGGSGPAR